MASINKITLIGNLGSDPKLVVLPSGDSVANLSLATTDRRSNGNGGYIDATEWHRIALYGKQAEVALKYLKKGSQVYVEGKLRSAIWMDREGKQRKTWTVIADRMQMLGKPESPSLDRHAKDRGSMEWMDGPLPEGSTRDAKAADNASDFDDDIPF